MTNFQLSSKVEVASSRRPIWTSRRSVQLRSRLDGRRSLWQRSREPKYLKQAKIQKSAILKRFSNRAAMKFWKTAIFALENPSSSCGIARYFSIFIPLWPQLQKKRSTYLVQVNGFTLKLHHLFQRIKEMSWCFKKGKK